MRKRFTVLGAVFLPAVAALSGLVLATGGSYAAAKAPATCSPNGTALAITAGDNKYNKDCLAAPPDQALTIAFDNQDYGIPHNVSIYDGDKTLFKGEVIDGPKKITYSVPALPAGKYQFRCDPHAEFMFGSFNVGG